MHTRTSVSACTSSEEGFYYLHIITEGYTCHASYLISKEKNIRLSNNKLKEGAWTPVSIGVKQSVEDNLTYLELIIEQHYHFFFLLSFEETYRLNKHCDLKTEFTHNSYRELL